MRYCRIAVAASLCVLPSFAQLTQAQKIADFQTMTAQFAKRYAAAGWKRTLLGVDVFDTQAFVDRVKASKNDLDFYDICIDYVAQFQDGGHVFFGVPSDFVADLNIRVDTYDGKPLIYSINRTVLPTGKYPFQIGDELISIDGQPAGDLMKSLRKYGIISTARTGDGYAAQALTLRRQSANPYAVNVPDSSVVVILRQLGGMETYNIPWTKTGVPLLADGPVSSPQGFRSGLPKGPLLVETSPTGDTADSVLPEAQYGMVDPSRAVTGVGSLAPIFNLPAGFQIRLGRNSATDAFVSGTYTAGGYTLGFIRIPSFSPGIGTALALAQFDTEVRYFQANTDGLVVDDTRNPGGLIYYSGEIARRLIPRAFHLPGFELRATTDWVRVYSSYKQFEIAVEVAQYLVDYYDALLKDVKTAASENGGNTGPLPLDILNFFPTPVSQSLDQFALTDRLGNPTAYSKPILILTDEFSFSSADYFAATMQDNKAATLFGMHTGGLGGTNASYNAGAYSEATVGMLRGLMVRKDPVSVDGFPTTSYVENIGVQPDIAEDYKTRDNLVNGGRTYVQHFTQALVDLIQKKQ